MAIPETQLDTWSHQGSVTQSKNTYASIKKVLEATGTKYAGKSFEVFLQGSYCNDTNIYAESDVDIVIRLDSTFYYDLSNLSSTETSAFQAAYPSDAAYSWHNFKADVMAALEESFGDDVKAGPNAIKIKANGTRRNADVLVAAQFRRYDKFANSYVEDHTTGICFFTNSGRVVNFPKQHSANCTAKHQATSSWFKPAVRILKNMRSKLEGDGLIAEGSAPSYYLEGLLYNVPNDKFGGSYEDTIVNSLNWIFKADHTKFVCANEQFYLLGNSAVTWPSVNCDSFLEAAKKLWNDWK